MGQFLEGCGTSIKVASASTITTINPASMTTDRLLRIVATLAAHHGLTGTIAAGDFLVDRGMTSMAMVDLMLMVETDFDVTIPQCDLVPSNFQSIEALACLLDRL